MDKTMPAQSEKRRCEFCGKEFVAYLIGKKPAAKFCGRRCYADNRKYFAKKARNAETACPAPTPAKACAIKPLRVSADWIMYAHQPPAESGIKSSAELVDLITDRDFVLIPVSRPDLAVELISCAELYTRCYGGDRDDRLRGMQASRVVTRAKQWIQAIAES